MIVMVIGMVMRMVMRMVVVMVVMNIMVVVMVVMAVMNIMVVVPPLRLAATSNYIERLTLKSDSITFFTVSITFIVIS